MPDRRSSTNDPSGFFDPVNIQTLDQTLTGPDGIDSKVDFDVEFGPVGSSIDKTQAQRGKHLSQGLLVIATSNSDSDLRLILTESDDGEVRRRHGY
jgi:hypothetical protein